MARNRKRISFTRNDNSAWVSLNFEYSLFGKRGKREWEMKRRWENGSVPLSLDLYLRFTHSVTGQRRERVWERERLRMTGSVSHLLFFLFAIAKLRKDHRHWKGVWESCKNSFKKVSKCSKDETISDTRCFTERSMTNVSISFWFRTDSSFKNIHKFAWTTVAAMHKMHVAYFNSVLRQSVLVLGIFWRFCRISYHFFKKILPIFYAKPTRILHNRRAEFLPHRQSVLVLGSQSTDENDPLGEHDGESESTTTMP